jgi:enamine deaminase RidA (YjgF/YER057c/UK114 family)
MPWEASYGYAQAVRVGDTVWISGQLGHDGTGKLVGDDVESQMRQTYANINTLLKKFGLTMDDVVEETAFTTDLPSASAARSKMGHEVYPDPTRVASNLIGVSRLFFPTQNIEIGVVAKTK